MSDLNILDPKTRISRYMSFATFFSLLTTQQMFFSALSTFSDRHEGSGTLSDELGYDNWNDRKRDAGKNLDLLIADNKKADGSPAPFSEDNARTMNRYHRILSYPVTIQTIFGNIQIGRNVNYRAVMSAARNWIDVSCWHQNVDESLAMWKIYGGGSSEAVWLNSTVGSLDSAIVVNHPAEKKIDPVKYIDYHTHVFERNDLFAPATHKQRPYSYEQEVRAIVWDRGPNFNIFAQRKEKGRLVHVDLIRLVSSIRLSPAAQPWFKELVKECIKGRLNVEVEQSIIDSDPIL